MTAAGAPGNSPLVAGPKLARDIGPGVGRQPNACRGCAAGGGQSRLGEGSRGGVSGNAARGWSTFPAVCIPGNNGADQGVPHAAWESALIRAVVLEILMERAGDGVLHCRFYSVGGETSSHAFAESFRSTAPLFGVLRHGRYAGPGGDTDCGFLAESLLFPMAAIGMVGGDGSRHSGDQ